MLLHHYHPLTGVYSYSGEAHSCPITGEALIPLHCTDIAPPDEYQGTKYRFDLSLCEWVAVPAVIEQSQEPEHIMTEADKAKANRSVALHNVLWLVERHTQQRELGTGTTLTDSEYKHLLQYIEDLRNYPNISEFWLQPLPEPHPSIYSKVYKDE